MISSAASLPATAKGAIQLNKGQQDITLKLRFDEFALKQIPFGVEHLEVAIDSSLIPNKGKTARFV